MEWLYYNPVKIRQGRLETLSSLFSENANTLLVTYEGAVAMHSLQSIAQLPNVKIFDRVPSNPTVDSVAETIREFARGKYNDLVALGGGSAIDTAKSVAVLHSLGADATGDQVRDALKSKAYRAITDIVPWVAIPTTAGTGADVTMWGTVWDPAQHAKLSIDAEILYAKETWLIPEFTRSMPPRLTLSTGLDALCHATEAYWAKCSNGMVRGVAAAAIRGILRHLPTVLADGNDMPGRIGMLESATLAGMAFSNTRTTACHALSYPLTLTYKMDHGLACALTLAAVAVVNAPAMVDLDSFLQAYGVKRVEDIQKKIDELCASILTLRLSAFGLTAEDALSCWDGELVPDRIGNNPMALTPDHLRQIALGIA